MPKCNQFNCNENANIAYVPNDFISEHLSRLEELFYKYKTSMDQPFVIKKEVIIAFVCISL